MLTSESKSQPKKTFTIVQRNLSRGQKTWYLAIYDANDGSTSYRSLKTDKKGEALSIMQQAAEDYGRRISGAVLDPREAKESYLSMMEAARYSSQTIGNVRAALKGFCEYCRENTIDNVYLFTPNDGRELLERWGGGKSSAIRKRYQQLKTFFSWTIAEHGRELQNPFDRVRAPKLERPQRYHWTQPQIDMILDHARNEETRLFYAFMAFAGLRFAEACAVKWSDMSGGALRLVGKGNKPAVLPIGSRLLEELRRYTEWLEASNPGERERQEKDGAAIIKKKSANMANYELRKAVRLAGVEAPGPVHIHRFRHSFGSNLINGGAPITAVSKLMRHENANITLQYYAHFFNEDLSAVLEIIK